MLVTTKVRELYTVKMTVTIACVSADLFLAWNIQAKCLQGEK